MSANIYLNHLYGIENKPWFKFIGGQAPQGPPPPHQYASEYTTTVVTGSMLSTTTVESRHKEVRSLGP